MLLLALFQTPDPETGNVRTADHWLHTPVAWIRFHHAARRELYFPDETGPDYTDLGHMRTIVFFQTSDDDWKTARFTLTCGDWMTRLHHQCQHLLCGLELRCFSALNLKSLLNRKHMTRLLEKPKHCLGQMSRLNRQRAQHNLAHLPYRSWCEHCVRAKGKEQQSQAKH